MSDALLNRKLAAARIVERIGIDKVRSAQLASIAAESLVADDVDPMNDATIASGVKAFLTSFEYLMTPPPPAVELARLEKLTPVEREAELKKAGVI